MILEGNRHLQKPMIMKNGGPIMRNEVLMKMSLAQPQLCYYYYYNFIGYLSWKKTNIIFNIVPGHCSSYVWRAKRLTCCKRNNSNFDSNSTGIFMLKCYGLFNFIISKKVLIGYVQFFITLKEWYTSVQRVINKTIW